MKAETNEENTMLLEQVQQWNAAGLWEKSLRTITALAEEDRDYNLCCVWAQCLYELQRGREALKVLDKIAVTGKEDWFWWQLYSHTVYALGRYKQALLVLNQRLQRFPDDVDARELLLQCQQVLLEQEIANSFQQRVADFWQVFAEREYEVRNLLLDGRQAEAEEYMKKLLLISFHAPVFQLELRENRGQLILSSDGSVIQLYGLAYWRVQAPQRLAEQWDFIVGQPPAEFLEQVALPAGDRMITPGDVLVWPVILPDGRLALECYSPVLLQLEQNAAYGLLYQLLNQCVGELCLLTNLAYAQIMETEGLSEPILLTELDDYIASLQMAGKLPPQDDPLGLFTTYDINPDQERWGLREDVYTGSISAAALPVLNSFYAGDSQIFDEAAQDGIVWAFVFYSCESIDAEQRVNVRAAIEEELQAVLIAAPMLGECVGGASGYRYSYLDCVSYNFEQFVQLVRQVMQPYIALYQIKEAGIYEFRKNGRYIPIEEELTQPAVLTQQQEQIESLLQPEKAAQYLLQQSLHGQFAVKDVINTGYLDLPQWQLSIAPVVTNMTETSAMVDFLISHPDWDRVLEEQATGLGSTPQEALQMVARNFLETMAQLFNSMKGNGELAQSTFAGQEHRWRCYPSPLLTRQKIPTDTQDYWSIFKDEILARLGNQRVCYVEFYGAKTEDMQTGVCRINRLECPELNQQIEQMTATWQVQDFTVQKQVVLLQQETETWTAYPHSREKMRRLVRRAAELFSAHKGAALLEQLQALTDDKDLAEELLVFLPEICAQHAFDKIIYPEQMTLDRAGELLTVYRSQLYSYEVIREAFFWNMDNGTFQGKENEIYSHLITVSSIYAAIEEAQEQQVDLEQEGGTVNTVYAFSREYKLR